MVTTADQPQATSEPSDTSVSMVACPRRTARQPGRWNTSPLIRTTGMVIPSTSHSQPAKRRAGIEEITIDAAARISVATRAFPDVQPGSSPSRWSSPGVARYPSPAMRSSRSRSLSRAGS